MLAGACALVMITLGGCAAVRAHAAPSGTAPAGSGGGAAAAPGPARTPTAPGTGIPFGPGPQSPYTVQAQPAAGSCHYRHENGYPLPDPACTPGALNPRVTPATVKTTICRAGYTASIRPPGAITRREKAANSRSYGYTGSARTGEYDHLVSLELGGDPNDPRNLWVEPNDKASATNTSNSKDAVENAAHGAICRGKITLAAAQAGIASDWIALGRRLGLTLPALG